MEQRWCKDTLIITKVHLIFICNAHPPLQALVHMFALHFLILYFLSAGTSFFCFDAAKTWSHDKCGHHKSTTALALTPDSSLDHRNDQAAHLFSWYWVRLMLLSTSCWVFLLAWCAAMNSYCSLSPQQRPVNMHRNHLRRFDTFAWSHC